MPYLPLAAWAESIADLEASDLRACSSHSNQSRYRASLLVETPLNLERKPRSLECRAFTMPSSSSPASFALYLLWAATPAALRGLM